PSESRQKRTAGRNVLTSSLFGITLGSVLTAARWSCRPIVQVLFTRGPERHGIAWPAGLAMTSSVHVVAIRRSGRGQAIPAAHGWSLLGRRDRRRPATARAGIARRAERRQIIGHHIQAAVVDNLLSRCRGSAEREAPGL